MAISKKLFQEIFDEAKKYATDEYDGSNSHAYFNIIEVIDSYKEKYPNIDDQTTELIIERIFTPPYEAFPT